MAYFNYTGRDSNGGLVKGVLEGKAEDAIAFELRERGVTPISIDKSDRNIELSEWLTRSVLAKGYALDDLILLFRQLYSLSRAGIPILNALHTVLKTEKKPVLIEALKKMVSGIESGLSLSRAMAQSPRIFSPVVVNMVNVGENTGRLDEVFSLLADYLDLEKNTLKELKQTTRYPLIVIIFITLAILVVNYFVVPNFVNVFNRLGADLPLPTTVLIVSSHIFVHYWWLLLLGLFSMLAMMLNYISTEEGRYHWDRLKLHVPLVGGIFERVILTRFSRVLSMMLKEGVPVLQSLSIVAEAVDNQYICRSVKAMIGKISSGESFTSSASASGLFNPIVIQMMAVGEETGALDQLLDEVALFYESEVEYDLKRFSDWVEPILVIMLAGMALVLALGVFLPLWDLGAAATSMR